MDHPEICGKHKFNDVGTWTKDAFDWQTQLGNPFDLRDLTIPTKRCDQLEQLWLNPQTFPTLAFRPLFVRFKESRKKKIDILISKKKQKANIYLLQETFSNPKDERIWSAEWSGQIFYSHGTEHSKGVCVLIKPNSLIQVEIVELDTNGRYIILGLKTPGEIIFNIVNIYAPTDYREQINFIESLTKNNISDWFV